MDEVTRLVEQAIRAATPPGSLVEQKIRPDSQYTRIAPTPAAGLQAALLVAKTAQQQAYKFALGLRGEGTPWTEIADLLDIPWSDEYSRRERAYELVRGSDTISGFHASNVYWYCRGPLGCGQHITDHGPYDGHPADTESGHADDCRRHRAEIEAYVVERDRQEERDRVADEAMLQLADDPFGRETARRARWSLAHGGRYQAWSTGETLAVALVLRDDAQLKADGWTRKTAEDRVLANTTHADRRRWLDLVRAAATGEQ